MPNAQAQEALAQAGSIRLQMSAVKRELANGGGRALAAALLEEPTEIVARMRLGVFLISIRQVGNRQAHRFCHRAEVPVRMLSARIGPFAPARGNSDFVLSERQRRELARVLRGSA